jgi:hypothetical protein
MSHRPLSALLGLVMTLMASTANCQDAPAPVKITLYPAAPPQGATVYHLLPPFLDRLPGNAAVYYGKVKAEQDAFFNNRQLRANIERWCSAPLDELRKENASVSLTNYYLREAALCDTCDWQLPFRREKETYSILLPEAQESRQFARILCAQARIDIAYGRYDAALERCQYSYALAQHVAKGETLVNGLIGIAVCGLTNQQLREMIQQADAPNLYWSLAMLPKSMVDFRNALDVELYTIERAVPDLRQLDRSDRTEEQWHATLTELWDFMSESADLVDQPAWDKPVETLVALSMQDIPAAKQALLNDGWSEERLASIPPAQVVLLDVMTQYRQISRLAGASYLLSYPEAMRGLTEAQQRLDSLQQSRHVMPLAPLLVSPLPAVRTAQARMEREFAVLMVLEALRLHAAKHDALPDRLSDIDVHIPNDPVTGRPFRYLRDGDVAKFGGPELPNAPLDYEITLRRVSD